MFLLCRILCLVSYTTSMQNQNPQSEQNNFSNLLKCAITLYLLMMFTTFGISSYLMLNLREGAETSIRDTIEKEVDRSYTRFFTQFNFAVFLIGTSVWVLRQSVINSLQTELKKQFKEEVEENFNKDLKNLREDVKRDFEEELKSLKSDLSAQRQKDEIIQELSILIPRPDLFFQEQVKPEIQIALKKLTAELEDLKSSNLNLCLTVEDYIKWGDGLYYSAWNSRPEAYNTWFNRNKKLGSPEYKQVIEYYEKAIAQYKEAISLQGDAYKAHLGMGNALTMSDKYEEAIKFYGKASQDKNISHIALVSRGLCIEEITRWQKRP